MRKWGWRCRDKDVMKRRRWKENDEIEDVEECDEKRGGASGGVDEKEVVMINAKMRMEVNT